MVWHNNYNSLRGRPGGVRTISSQSGGNLLSLGQFNVLNANINGSNAFIRRRVGQGQSLQALPSVELVRSVLSCGVTSSDKLPGHGYQSQNDSRCVAFVKLINRPQYRAKGVVPFRGYFVPRLCPGVSLMGAQRSISTDCLCHQNNTSSSSAECVWYLVQPRQIWMIFARLQPLRGMITTPIFLMLARKQNSSDTSLVGGTMQNQ